MNGFGYSKCSTAVNRSPSPYISSSPTLENSKIKNDITNYSTKSKFYSNANDNKYYQISKSPLEDNYEQNNFSSTEYSYEINSNSPKDKKKNISKFGSNIDGKKYENDSQYPNRENDYSYNKHLITRTNETMKKTDDSVFLQRKIDQLNRENENLKNENRLLNEDSQKLKDIENIITNQGCRNGRNKTKPIGQIIETIIGEKKSAISLISQKDDQIENLQKQRDQYKTMIDSIQIKVNKLFNIQENNPKMTLEQLIENAFMEQDKKYKLYRREYNKLRKENSQNSPQKQNDIKKLIIEKGQIKPEDQNKTETELLNQILNENAQFKNILLKISKENKIYNNNITKIKIKLIEEGNLQAEDYQSQKIDVIINKIFSDKKEVVETLNTEINYLQNEIKELKSNIETLSMQKGKLYEDQNINKYSQNSNEEIGNQLSDQIEQIQDLLTSLNETKLSIQTKIDDIDHKKEEEIERINEQNEQLKEKINDQRNIILSLTNEKEELKNQTEQLQKNADEQENIISLLKQEKEELKNQTENLQKHSDKQENIISSLKHEKEELKNQKDSSIDVIKKNTAKILEMLENNDQLREVKTLIQPEKTQNSNTLKDNEEEENLDQSEEKEDNLQKEEEEDKSDQRKDEEVQLDQTKEKEILDELVEILKNDSYLNDEYLENKYDFVINKVQEMINKIKNDKENSEKDVEEKEESIDASKKIKKLKDHNDILNKQINEKDQKIKKLECENKKIQKQKVLSDDLLRRHITLVQSENDKQLKRIKYLQKLEINEILKNKISKEKANDDIKNTNEKIENNDDDDDNDDSENSEEEED